MSIEYVNLPLNQRSRARTTSSDAAPVKPGPEVEAKAAPHDASRKPARQEKTAAPAPAAPATLQPLGPEVGSTTEFLLDGQTAVSNIATPSSETDAVIEEAAIMYANGQASLTTQMLQAAIASDDLGELPQTAWLMLLDLHQISGRQAEFEELAIDYASRFETSPPAWTDRPLRNQPQTTAAAATPTVPFSGKLDGGCEKQIERIRNLAEHHRTLRLEFAKVTAVDAAGCGLLLATLRKLQKSGHDLVLVGASELADRIRAIIEVGRRDDTEDCWLLLLEVLQLLNREKEFEELSIDYCVTFEVSPPAFVAPSDGIVNAPDESSAPVRSEHFMMPAVVSGQVDELIVAIATYSDEHDPAIIDCSCLERMDFNAASRLLTGLSPFCGNGKAIEFHHVNHLVDVLLKVIGLSEIIRITPRRN
ncbi:STAS domain-containing protein [Noviherbaspirillum aerium]|uniref:STAS domain-containing protein n=1 Tax=Noviherbaspirillum aerium TaxID=2588497 RepID=UPI001CEFAACA|nr:STAS domain-containing protein [Noviherbaspirillum aerium]